MKNLNLIFFFILFQCFQSLFSFSLDTKSNAEERVLKKPKEKIQIALENLAKETDPEKYLAVTHRESCIYRRFVNKIITETILPEFLKREVINDEMKVEQAVNDIEKLQVKFQNFYKRLETNKEDTFLESKITHAQKLLHKNPCVILEYKKDAFKNIMKIMQNIQAIYK